MTVLQSTNPEYIVVPDGRGSALTLSAARSAASLSASTAEAVAGPNYDSIASRHRQQLRRGRVSP